MNKLVVLISVLFVMLVSVSLTSCSNEDEEQFLITSSLRPVVEGMGEDGISYQITSFKMNTLTEFTEYFYVQDYHNGKGAEIYFETTSGEWFAIRQYTNEKNGELLYVAFNSNVRPETEFVSLKNYTVHVDRRSIEIIFSGPSGRKMKQIISLEKY